ncbi:MAG: hypothetical protein COT17_05605 [Elusimicrobia bacterium CG08_land_8_20_14_0_20_51_18]|nr:MAG: hypothetical protein COT17_05605 [Elusimicrobia bacterium CG08_land_8_20_14_0_20_51_18]
MNDDKNASSSDIYRILGVNLLVLPMVWLFNWDISEILILYLGESGIIIFLNSLKILFANSENYDLNQFSRNHYPAVFLFSMLKFLISVVSVFMYGAALWIMWLILSMLIFPDNKAEPEMTAILYSVRFGLLAFFLNHCYSFIMFYLRGDDYKNVKIETMLAEPAKGIVGMYFALIIGGIVVYSFTESVNLWGILIVLVLVKLLIDLRNYVKGVWPRIYNSILGG